MEVMQENLDEKLIPFPSSSSVDSGISVETNSNESPTGSGDEFVKPKEKSNNGFFFLPFSPLKERTISEVAVPMFPNHKSAVKFSPPVRTFRQRHCFECGEKMAELLSRLPDYEQFQPELVRSIYVAHQTPKRQCHQMAAKNGYETTDTRMAEV